VKPSSVPSKGPRRGPPSQAARVVMNLKFNSTFEVGLGRSSTTQAVGCSSLKLSSTTITPEDQSAPPTTHAHRHPASVCTCASKTEATHMCVEGYTHRISVFISILIINHSDSEDRHWNACSYIWIQAAAKQLGYWRQSPADKVPVSGLSSMMETRVRIQWVHELSAQGKRVHINDSAAAEMTTRK
jgi:hypothetical protein